MTKSSSPSSSSKSASLPCQSITVYAGTFGGKIHTLTPEECSLGLSVNKRSGIGAGHRWRIGHRDLDFERFLGENGRLLDDGWDGGRNGHDGGGHGRDGDGREYGADDMDYIDDDTMDGSDEIKITVKNIDQSREFECIVQNDPMTIKKKVRKFASDFVRIHERWRDKNPQLAQRISAGAASIGSSGAGGGGRGRGATGGSKTSSGRKKTLTNKSSKFGGIASSAYRDNSAGGGGVDNGNGNGGRGGGTSGITGPPPYSNSRVGSLGRTGHQFKKVSSNAGANTTRDYFEEDDQDYQDEEDCQDKHPSSKHNTKASADKRQANAKTVTPTPRSSTHARQVQQAKVAGKSTRQQSLLNFTSAVITGTGAPPGTSSSSAADGGTAMSGGGSPSPTRRPSPGRSTSSRQGRSGSGRKVYCSVRPTASSSRVMTLPADDVSSRMSSSSSPSRRRRASASAVASSTTSTGIVDSPTKNSPGRRGTSGTTSTFPSRSPRNATPSRIDSTRDSSDEDEENNRLRSRKLFPDKDEDGDKGKEKEAKSTTVATTAAKGKIRRPGRTKRVARKAKGRGEQITKRQEWQEETSSFDAEEYERTEAKKKKKKSATAASPGDTATDHEYDTDHDDHLKSSQESAGTATREARSPRAVDEGEEVEEMEADSQESLQSSERTNEDRLRAMAEEAETAEEAKKAKPKNYAIFTPHRSNLAPINVNSTPPQSPTKTTTMDAAPSMKKRKKKARDNSSSPWGSQLPNSPASESPYTNFGDSPSVAKRLDPALGRHGHNDADGDRYEQKGWNATAEVKRKQWERKRALEEGLLMGMDERSPISHRDEKRQRYGNRRRGGRPDFVHQQRRDDSPRRNGDRFDYIEHTSNHFGPHPPSLTGSPTGTNEADRALGPRRHGLPNHGHLSMRERKRLAGRSRRAGYYGADRGWRNDTGRDSWSKFSNGRFGRGSKSFDKSTDNVAVGLQNLGNTCYLNSSLQTLFSVPGFAQDLLGTCDSIAAKYESAGSKPKLRLAKALLEVAADLGVIKKPHADSQAAGESNEDVASKEEEKEKLVANPTAVKRAMDALSDKFQGYEQRDAHEFLGDLIDSLHDELAAALKAAKAGEDEKMDEDIELPTDKYFRLDAEVTLTCEECKYARNKEELYRHLSIGVGAEDDAPWSVERGLEEFFKPEKREIKCEKCPCGTVTQEMKVIKKPWALLVHFKRFIVTMEPRGQAKAKPVDKENQENNGGNVAPPSATENSDEEMPPLDEVGAKPAVAAPVEISFHKNKARVTLQESISLDRFCKNEEDSKDGAAKATDAAAVVTLPEYDATVVVHHIGGTACSGHYTADALRTKLLGLLDKDGNIADGEKKWVVFDDRATSFTDSSSVLGEERSQRNAYMALYFAP